MIACQNCFSNCYSPLESRNANPLATRARWSRSVTCLYCPCLPALVRQQERRAQGWGMPASFCGTTGECRAGVCQLAFAGLQESAGQGVPAGTIMEKRFSPDPPDPKRALTGLFPLWYMFKTSEWIFICSLGIFKLLLLCWCSGWVSLCSTPLREVPCSPLGLLLFQSHVFLRLVSLLQVLRVGVLVPGRELLTP